MKTIKQIESNHWEVLDKDGKLQASCKTEEQAWEWIFVDKAISWRGLTGEAISQDVVVIR
jgi:hypothetical protein